MIHDITLCVYIYTFIYNAFDRSMLDDFGGAVSFDLQGTPGADPDDEPLEFGAVEAGGERDAGAAG